jgi:hypothetical protein
LVISTSQAWPVAPFKAHPVLVADPHAPLALPVAGKLLKPVATRYAEVVDRSRPIDLIEPTTGLPEQVGGTGSPGGLAVRPIEHVPRPRVPKGPDHVTDYIE